MLIDDITHHEIFTGQPTLEPMLDVASRAVSSYPLIAGDRILGVLSFHYRKPGAAGQQPWASPPVWPAPTSAAQP